jgi:hypothetical protein
MPKLPSVRIEGSRLADLAVTSSAYGETITLGFGTIRLAGNIIWGQEIREQKVTTKSTAGGKGGGGQTTKQVDYFYFSSIAIGFAEGPADKLLRQWGDGKTFYDIRAGVEASRMDDLVFRFYRGTEEQEPDPLILSVEGADNTPAYRGTVYLVLEDLPLADFSNRIPNITVEINFEQGQPVSIILTVGDDLADRSLGAPWDFFVDWQRGRVYAGDAFAGTDEHILVYNLSNLAYVETQDVRGLFTSAPIDLQGKNFFGLDQRTGYLCGAVDGGPIESRNYVYDPFSKTLITELDSTEEFALVSEDVPYSIVTFVSDIGENSAVFGAGFGAQIRVHSFPDLVFKQKFFGPEPGVEYTSGPNMGDLKWHQNWTSLGANGEVWHIWTHEDELRIMRYDLDAAGGVTETTVGSIFRTELSPTSLFRLFDSIYPNYDLVTGALIFTIQMDADINDNFVVKWTPESGIVWKSDVRWVEEQFSMGRASTRLSDQLWVYGPAVPWVQTVDLKTGAVFEDFAIDPNNDGSHWWDDRSGCFYQWNTGVTNFQSLETHCFSGQSAAPTDLASVIERVAIRAGLDPVLDVDASAAIGIGVEGYEISTESDGASVLEGLMEIHSYTVAEYDGIIQFIARGGGVGITIDQDDMIVNPRRKGFTPYDEEIEEEIDLPERFTVEFQNRELDYQTDIRGTTRVLTPDPTVFTTNTFELDLPLVMAPIDAKKKSEILLYQSWIEAVQYKAQVPFEFLALAPGDPINLTFANGLSVRVRTERADMGNDFSIKARFRSESTGQYVSAAFTESGESISQAIQQAEPSKLFLWGGPLLRDVDATNRTATRTYFGGGPLGLITTNWPGMRLVQSIDSGASYDLWGTNLISCPWGTAKNALADPISWNLTDTVNFLDVAMVEGEERLESVTALDIANNRNAAILFKRNGTHEYFQFQTVTALGGNVFRLSILARGRRGTEAMAYLGHETGEEFMLVDPAAIEGNLQSLASVGASRLYKPVTLGALEELTTVFPFADVGRDLMPYEPVHILATIDGIDIDWTWKRRTRVGGAYLDFVDVPLSEETESYELDIFASQGATTALRTLVSATEAVTYTDAQITTDFGSIPATIWIELYQLSAEVGRGFARRLEITVL